MEGSCWSVCSLCLLVCQLKVNVGDSAVCSCVPFYTCDVWRVLLPPFVDERRSSFATLFLSSCSSEEVQVLQRIKRSSKHTFTEWTIICLNWPCDGCCIESEVEADGVGSVFLLVCYSIPASRSMCFCTDTQIHARTHTHAHTHKHTHTRARTHTHTQTHARSHRERDCES